MKLEWLEIPKGEFLYGLSEQQIIEVATQMTWLKKEIAIQNLSYESPQSIIALETFYIARFPITNGQMREFITQGRFDEKVVQYTRCDRLEESNHPISCPWGLAMAFCAWIGARLPTTYEWEKAARGTDGRLYPWGNQWHKWRGNFGLMSARERAESWPTSAVGAYPEAASPYGVEDAVGNCYQWTLTLSSHPSEFYARKWPKEYEHGQHHVLRGSPPEADMSEPAQHLVTNIRLTDQWTKRVGWPKHSSFRPVMDTWQRENWVGFRVRD
jgi:serine/threonine-protein kinase